MCVDIFAPGSPITIDFLHERIYFLTKYDDLTAVECCDVFVRNDDPTRPIDRLRIQFPHFVDWTPDKSEHVEIVSQPIVEKEQFWYGSYQSVHGDRFAHDPGDDTGIWAGHAIKGTFRQPEGTGTLEEFRAGMRSLHAMVLDLHLDTPIRDAHGWLRLTVRPSTWPRDEMFPLSRQCSVGGVHEFMARLRVSSPGMLREDLHVNIQHQRPDWMRPLVTEGWMREKTLTRAIDHRVTLIFAREALISHLTTSTKPKPILTVEPFSIDTPEFSLGDGLARFAQTFLTGSATNKESDVVLMANRIRDYIRTRSPDPHRIPPVSKPELVTRFGGLHQEAVGTLIREMIENGLLRKAGVEAHEDLFVPETNHGNWQEAMTNLRRKYTLLQQMHANVRSFYAEFRDLHPFHISFTLRWSAHTERQEQKISRLRTLLDETSSGFDFTGTSLSPKPRRAVIVTCGECADKALGCHSFLGKLGEELAGILKSIGQFDVRLVRDPENGDEMLEPITEAMDKFSGTDQGLFLFWFLGHALPVQVQPSQTPELHLCHRNSAKQGVRWTTLLEKLTNSRIAKVLVLDCCYAGLATFGSLPSMSYLWPVSGPNHTTLVTDANGRSIGFTQAARDLLLDGIPGGDERKPITFPHLLSQSQTRFGQPTSHPTGKYEGALEREKLEAAINLSRYDILPTALRRQLRNQVVAGVSN